MHILGNKRGKVVLSSITCALIILMMSFMLTGCSSSQDQPTKVQNQDSITTENNKAEDLATNRNTVQTVANQDQQNEVNGQLKVHFIDVGQADSILLENEGHFMLIDAGNNADSNLVVNYLKGQGVNKLDYVVGTHPHEDHIGGLDAVINTFSIGKVYMPKVNATTKTFKDVVAAIKNKGLKITTPVPGSSFNLGNVKCTILAPNSSSYDDVNNYSIVIKAIFGSTSYLFTGDAEDISENEILQKGFDISADVLKVGHHGSHSSSTDAFLNKVNSKYAVICVGKDNDYGHPHQETMDKLKNRGIKVYRTDQCGTIVSTSDGTDISFDANPGDYSYNNLPQQSNSSNTPSQTNEKAYVDSNGQGLIKGNINSKGEKIYHMPDGAYYDKTIPEELFNCRF